MAMGEVCPFTLTNEPQRTYHLRRLRYPRIAALAFSAAAVIASFADLAPDTTSLTPIMKTSRMDLDCGWKRIALARSDRKSVV